MNANLAYQTSLYDQLCALRMGVTGEIPNGRLHTQISGSGRHAVAITGLLANIGSAFDFARNGPGGWRTLHKPEIHFIRDTEVAVPDPAGWRRERMPQVPDGHRFEVVPDCVCEILSPSTARKDRFVKLPIYAKYGVTHAWLVDPEAHTLEAYELRDGFWTLIATLQDDAPVWVAPFDAIEFSLADLWA
ncbi:MAG: Uma2 family endonuclease [Gallionellaceae bacterium]|nr:Uma2 family endonuclease [Gallionellaceae bacterium]